MRCRHCDWLKSDVLTVGAEVNLFLSILFNVKVGFSVLVAYCADDELVFNNVQGTGTNLFGELGLALASFAEAFAVELPLEAELIVSAAPFNDSNAKSIRPDLGLMIVSSIVAICLPEESFTAAPINCVARTECSPSLPVALKCLVLKPRVADESFGVWLCDSDCAHADAVNIEHAAHTAEILRNAFFITKFLLLVLLRKQPTRLRAVQQ